MMGNLSPASALLLAFCAVLIYAIISNRSAASFRCKLRTLFKVLMGIVAIVLLKKYEKSYTLSDPITGGKAFAKAKAKMASKTTNFSKRSNKKATELPEAFKFDATDPRFKGKDEFQIADTVTCNLFTTGGKPALNHCRPANYGNVFGIPENVAPITANPKRILDLSEKQTVKYTDKYVFFKFGVHWGQLKLLLSEVEFLTIALKEAREKGCTKLTLIYAGSAHGIHIPYLYDLFSSAIELKFVLVDPARFDAQLYAPRYAGKIAIYNGFYNDERIAQMREEHPLAADEYLCFCSDIRISPDERAIVGDMKMQFDWWHKMNADDYAPDLSMFKFRLPWADQGMSEYPKGDIHLQVYAGETSPETRLIVPKRAPLHLYDDAAYEHLCFKHNIYHRSNTYLTPEFGKLDLATSEVQLCNCYDCTCFVRIMVDAMTELGMPMADLSEQIIAAQKSCTSHFEDGVLKKLLFSDGKRGLLCQTFKEYRRQIFQERTKMLRDRKNHPLYKVILSKTDAQ